MPLCSIHRSARTLLAGLLVLASVSCGGGGGGGGGLADAGGPDAAPLFFDFQDALGPIEPGFTAVTPADLYDAGQGYGFTTPPEDAVDGTGFTWTLFGDAITVAQAIPPSVLSSATIDCVTSSAGPMVFRADVEPGNWDVTLWLGDVTTPRHQVRVTANGVVADVDRLEINTRRGSFDKALFGSAVPITLRVNASKGFIELTVATSPTGAQPITWTFLQDEDPKNPPTLKTETLVQAFSAAPLQALVLTPAAHPPLIGQNGVLLLGDAPSDPDLTTAIAKFNAGDLPGAQAAFSALTDDGLRAAKAAGLFWVAGHPATSGTEVALLDQAGQLLSDVLADDPENWAALLLALQVSLARDAEGQRLLYGYEASDSGAVQNMGRSCALAETFFDTDLAYSQKSKILWLRNRGGLDPQRVTISWERAQWQAQQLAPQWAAVNPHVRLYATDQWDNDGAPWLAVDWGTLAGSGPTWARDLVRSLNSWLDIFEWWGIHRQSIEGDIGGGWTDDVEILPAFGVMAMALPGASDISASALVRFSDGIWSSGVIDQQAAYQAAYADVEHTAEATGNLLHVVPLVRFGDASSIERMLLSVNTFDSLFLQPDLGGHRHFKGNHMSATQIAINPAHQLDIPLCGRVTAPFPFLLWFSDNPGVEAPLRAWIDAWISDSASTAGGKPAGVFPHGVWAPTDTLGSPSGSWWAQDVPSGQFFPFPKNHEYLYNLAGTFWLRTGDDSYRAPFDALSSLAAAWINAGEPAPGSAPINGAEDTWAGALLAPAMDGPAVNLAINSGLSDWDAYLAVFGSEFAKFRLNPTAVTGFPGLANAADSLFTRWPYKTTEGVMTDRILESGWERAVSYYIGADPLSLLQGMPVHAVTWSGASRLFAAAVAKNTPTDLEATVYLFEDSPRSVTMNCWQLQLGARYQLSAGPTTGLGQPASTINQVVTFDYDQLGDGPTFQLPGRTETALSITQIMAAPAPTGARPDLGLSQADVTYAPGTNQLSVTVHNLGSVATPGVPLQVIAGTDPGGPVLATTTVPPLAAPIDLAPKRVTMTVPHDGTSPVTVVVDPNQVLTQITDANDTVTVWIAGDGPDGAPPMLISASPDPATSSSLVTLSGKQLLATSVVILDQDPSAPLPITFVDDSQIVVQLPAGLPAGIHLFSVQNIDGQISNPLPLTISG